MSALDFLLICVAVILNSSAALLIKHGAQAVIRGGPHRQLKDLVRMMWPAVNRFTLIGTALLLVSFILFVFIVSRVNISIAQPLFSLAYIFITIGAYFFFKEPLSRRKLSGIAVIILGVYLVSGGIQ